MDTRVHPLASLQRAIHKLLLDLSELERLREKVRNAEARQKARESFGPRPIAHRATSFRRQGMTKTPTSIGR
jgi:hypothetical protein